MHLSLSQLEPVVPIRLGLSKTTTIDLITHKAIGNMSFYKEGLATTFLLLCCLVLWLIIRLLEKCLSNQLVTYLSDDGPAATLGSLEVLFLVVNFDAQTVHLLQKVFLALGLDATRQARLLNASLLTAFLQHDLTLIPNLRS